MPLRRVDGVPAAVPLPERYVSARLRVDTVKFLADGGLSGATAALSVPYRHADTRGVLRFDRDELLALCRESHDAGWRIAIHAIGDVAIDQVLAIYEALGPIPRGLAHRLEHFGLPDARQLARAARLGVIAVPQAIFIHSLGPQFPRLPAGWLPAAVLSDSRDARCRRLRWPCPPTPRSSRTTIRSWACRPRSPVGIARGSSSRRSRRSPSARRWPPTRSAAQRRAGRRAQLGVIAPGAWADLAVLSGDPFVTPADELSAITVEQTWLGGQCVYERA